MDILYHNDGNFYIFMGGGPLIRAGNTVDDLMNALCGDWEHAVWKYIRHQIFPWDIILIMTHFAN